MRIVQLHLFARECETTHQVGLCLPRVYPFGNLKPLTSGVLQIVVETGLMGRQANGAVTVTDGETVSGGIALNT